MLRREEEAAARKALENATNREDPSSITEWLKVQLINAHVERELEIMTASDAEDPARTPPG